MGKINQFFIKLLQAYVYIAIIIGIIIIFSMGNYLGVGTFEAIISFLLIVPLMFGMFIIQIDNNSLLREIKEKNSGNYNRELLLKDIRDTLKESSKSGKTHRTY